MSSHLRHCPPVRKLALDLKNLRARQLRARATFASVVRTVQEFVSFILSTRAPAQMAWSATSTVPLMTQVSSLILWRRRRTIKRGAKNSINVEGLHAIGRFSSDRWSQLASSGERPEEAGVAVISECLFYEKICGVARSLVKRITMPFPAIIVIHTKAASIYELAAALDRAYSPSRHVDPSLIDASRRGVLTTRPRHLLYSQGEA